MSPRTGRPIKGNSKKNGRFELRLNEAENALLEKLSQEYQLPKAEIIMMAVINLANDEKPIIKNGGGKMKSNRTTDFINVDVYGQNGEMFSDNTITDLGTIADEMYNEQIRDLLDSYGIADDNKDYSSMLLDAICLGFYYGKRYEKSCNAGDDPQFEQEPIKKLWETASERAREIQRKEDEKHEAMMEEAYARNNI